MMIVTDKMINAFHDYIGGEFDHFLRDNSYNYMLGQYGGVFVHDNGCIKMTNMCAKLHIMIQPTIREELIYGD